ncbi:MAG: CopG family transcriptional regulator [Bacteroidota bacterium]
MSFDGMVRRQLYLSQNLNRQLKVWAREKKISESEIMREALTQFLEREKRRATLPEDNPVYKMKGIFSGDEGCSLAGEKHDEILYDIGNKE